MLSTFTPVQKTIIELVSSLALEYDCTVVIEEAEDDYVLSYVSDGERSKIGAISAIKSMTIRGLMGIFESSVIAKKCREGVSGDAMIPGD